VLDGAGHTWGRQGSHHLLALKHGYEVLDVRWHRPLTSIGVRRNAGDQCAMGESHTSITYPMDSRTMAAPSVMARSFWYATARGRYFMPQSGATINRSGGT
jgi:hypothetical protein